MFSPESFAYQSNSNKASFRDFSLPSKINDVSSANYDNLCAILVTSIPPIFLLPCILMAKISAHKMKKYGDNGSISLSTTTAYFKKF